MRSYTYLIVAFGLILSSPLHAVTMIADETFVTNEQSLNETIVRTKLVIRNADGKIETSRGTYSTLSAEVVDNRPIDSWYKPDKEANVTLYYRDKRLVRVVIY